MKPLKLTVQAFGPFAQRHEIDFTQLGKNPLFLINGRTGSGKSTLLDAMAFALYGDTTGKEREASDMRCQYADEQTLTEVEFTFSLGQQTYHILRKPQQERKKSRGEGTTTQNAEAYLYQLQSDGSEDLLVSKRLKEFNEKIIQLIGLDSEQFRQVMVLPQGLFRKLLLAESKEREPILSKLFQTEGYKRVEERIKAQAADVRQQMQQHQQQIKGILKAVECSSREQLAEQLSVTETEFNQQQPLKQQAAHQLKHAEISQQNAQSLQARFIQRDQLLEQQVRHLAQQPHIEGLKQQWQQVQAAHHLNADYQRQQQTQHAVNKTQHALGQDQLHADQAQQAWLSADQIYQHAHQATEALDALKQQRHQLSVWQPKLSELEQALTRWQNAQTAEQRQDALHQQAQHQLQHASAQRQHSQQTLHGLEQNRLNETEIRLAIQQQKMQLEQHQAWSSQNEKQHTLHTQLAQLDTECKQAQQRVETAQQQLNQFEYHWHLGQAAVLAQTLEPQQACPVCGSCDHPAPAQWQNDIQPVEKSEIEQAKQQLHHRQQTWSALQSRYANLHSQIDSAIEQRDNLASKLGDAINLSAFQLKNQLSVLEQQDAACQQQAADMKNITISLQKIEQQCQTLTEQTQQHNQAWQMAHTQTQLAHQAYQQIEQHIPHAFREANALQQAMDQLTHQIGQIEAQFRQAQQQRETALKTMTQAQETHHQRQALLTEQQIQLERETSQWHTALTQSVFENQAAFLRALADQVQQQAWSHQIEQFQQQSAQIEGKLQHYNQDLHGQLRPNLDEVNRQLEQQQQAFAQVDAVFNQVAGRLTQLNNIAHTLKQSDQKNQALEAEFKIIGTLSEVLCGDNNAKISLQRFVLGVLLDDVLINATTRLRTLTKGRYELIRKDARSKGQKASGLELDVFDSYTGKSRPVATLSGGESFLAALSLALGLSDVVQSYAGGIKLDTLFIDEGFGSLDPESLELAIDSLKNLQTHGRTIGIISHVQELKEQMPLRIDVTATAQGSEVKVVGIY